MPTFPSHLKNYKHKRLLLTTLWKIINYTGLRQIIRPVITADIPGILLRTAKFLKTKRKHPDNENLINFTTNTVQRNIVVLVVLTLTLLKTIEIEIQKIPLVEKMYKRN